MVVVIVVVLIDSLVTVVIRRTSLAQKSSAVCLFVCLSAVEVVAASIVLLLLLALIASLYGSGASALIPAEGVKSTTTCGQTEPKLGFGSQAGRRTSVLASRIGAQREGAQTSVLVPRPGKGQDIGPGLPDR